MQQLTADDLRRRGFTPSELRRAVADGRLTRLRRGVWVEGGGHDADDLFVQRSIAATRASKPDAVLSHASAAALWSLPRTTPEPEIWLTRPGRGQGHVRGGLHTVRAPLPDEQVVVRHGMRVTSLPRTVVDVARTSPFPQGVVVADAALRRGCTRDELHEQLAWCRRWPGMALARQVVDFADARSESAYESLTRVLLDRMGLPAPVLQLVITSEAGEFVARVDFALPELGLVIEYDGETKYDELLPAGHGAGSAFAREKERDRAIRRQGWYLLHLGKRDVHDWERFQRVVGQALVEARRWQHGA